MEIRNTEKNASQFHVTVNSDTFHTLPVATTTKAKAKKGEEKAHLFCICVKKREPGGA